MENLIFKLRDLLTDNDVEVPSELHKLTPKQEIKELLALIYACGLHRDFYHQQSVGACGHLKPEVIQAERLLNLCITQEAADAKKWGT